jgi:hypothetical protein
LANGIRLFSAYYTHAADAWSCGIGMLCDFSALIFVLALIFFFFVFFFVFHWRLFHLSLFI